MPLYVLIAHDIPNSATLRAQHRPEHLARLQALQAQNRLILAGPTPIEHGHSPVSGSLIVAEFTDEMAVREWINDEPFLRHGIYSHIDIKPFIQVLPE